MSVPAKHEQESVRVSTRSARAEPPGSPGPDHRPGPGRRPLLAGGIALLVVAILIVVIRPFGSSSESGDDVAEGADPNALATVEEGALTRQVYESGTLGYAARPDGSPYSVVNQAAGAYTALPSAGDVIGCGQVIYRADNEPVALLCGETPAFRALSQGMSGPDVRVLNRNLVRLGHASEDELDPESNYVGAATATALARLQGELGIDETGSLEPGQAVFLPGPLRIGETMATLGAPAQPGEPIARATSTEREVLVELSASQRTGVEVGDRARITLPDNTTTPAEVSRIGAVASSSSSGEGEDGSESESEGDRIPVYVALKRPRDARGLDEAPVQVEITTGRVEDALSVPVTALLAQAGGGYAVETVADGGERELVPVELGAFDQANGLVEVRESNLSAGQRVVVPAT